MSRSLDEANRELSRIRDMPYGLARTQAAERQVRLVEAEGPDRARAYALSVLLESMVWGGEVERSYLPFTQLVRWYDEHPEQFDDADRYAMFWSFKWMVGHLGEFPTVPAAQIEATLDDMERRYALAGLGRDAVAYARFAWAARRGAEDVEEAYRTWVATPRDDYSQCEVCDPGDRASHLFATGRLAEGVRLVEETLATGATCATEPADMLSHLALAHLDLGHRAEAARAHRRAVAALADATGEMAGARGRRVVLLGRAGAVARLVRAVEQDERLLLEAETPRARLEWLLGVVAGTAALLPAHADAAVRLTRVPAATVADLHGWAVGEAEALAAAFDLRDGGTALTTRLAEARATRPLDEPLELDVVALPGASARPVVDATGAGSDDGPDGAGADGDEPLLARAERLLADGSTEEAARAFVAASTAAEEAGLLVDAGYAAAEAARCAQVLGDDDTAAGLYAHAVARLHAGGAEPVQVVPVLVAWAPAAAAAGALPPYLEAVDAVRAALDADDTDGAPDPAGQALADRRRTERRRALADVDDAAARALATLGGDARTQDAVDRAVRAGEAYASVGAVADAAHAFWLAGRVLDTAGRTEDALHHLETAVEGFGLARDRRTRAQAADDLVALLRRTGQDARAEEVLEALTR
ncbi:hypothetical protein [Cellulomonas sp.]|uniref:hypothetical protein n=1 Tax=Cellulomonas sp. TaxID=40001 RepID=UPI0028119716|nr:hypothetical protein [Cellulomonas sp.]